MKKKLKEWIKRYLPAEILSVIATLFASVITFRVTGNYLSTALVGTWVGNIAYFGYILIADIVRTGQECHTNNTRYTFRHFLKSVRNLIIEFGLAEVVDSFFIRPALMYYLPILFHNLTLGILLAKIMADITFYIPAIISYELSKKHLRKVPE